MSYVSILHGIAAMPPADRREHRRWCSKITLRCQDCNNVGSAARDETILTPDVLCWLHDISRFYRNRASGRR